MALASRHTHPSRVFNRPFFESLVDAAAPFLPLETTDEKPDEDPESPDESSAKRKWTPTPAALNKLLAALSPEYDKAGQEYELVRLKLHRFFEWRGCNAGDRLADEVFDRVMRRLDEGQIISNIKAYVYSVAKFVLKEWLKEKEHTSLTSDTSDAAVDLQSTADEDNSPRIHCFEECLGRLPDEEREILIEYYTGEKREKIEGRTKLAAKLNISVNALRIRVHRIRKELEECVRTCMGRGEF
jgi:RNA polymerase sigma factor (sigma-70 family)